MDVFKVSEGYFEFLIVIRVFLYLCASYKTYNLHILLMNLYTIKKKGWLLTKITIIINKRFT